MSTAIHAAKSTQFNRVMLLMKIAIIGSGIAGLTCAHLLARQHAVTVFESASWIGGHTHTVDVRLHGRDYAVDTGFIVFNDWTYPNFIKLLGRLGVRYKPTEMSFSVHDPASGLEYNGNNLNSLFAQRRRYTHNSALHLPPAAEGRRICNIWRTITGDQ